MTGRAPHLVRPFREGREIRRKRCSEAHTLARYRVVEAERRRMEKLPGHTACELVRPTAAAPTHPPFPASTIDLVPHDRMSDVAQMHPDLVRPAGLQRDVQKVRPQPTLGQSHPREGVPTVLDGRHPLPVARVPANGRVDGEGVLIDVTPHERLIE